MVAGNELALVAINSVLLMDGRVLVWDGGPACIGSSSPRVWDPQIDSYPCSYSVRHRTRRRHLRSGQTLPADGRVMVVGDTTATAEIGIKMVNIFDLIVA